MSAKPISAQTKPAKPDDLVPYMFDRNFGSTKKRLNKNQMLMMQRLNNKKSRYVEAGRNRDEDAAKNPQDESFQGEPFQDESCQIDHVNPIGVIDDVGVTTTPLDAAIGHTDTQSEQQKQLDSSTGAVGVIGQHIPTQELGELDDHIPQVDPALLDPALLDNKSELLPNKVISAQELAKSKELAWNEGFDTCKARYEEFIHQGVFDSIAALPELFHALVDAQKSIVTNAHTRTMQVLAANAKELASVEMNKTRRDRIEKLLDENVEILMTKPFVKVRAHPETIELMRPSFERDELSYITIDFVAVATMEKADIAIDWGNGGIERDVGGYLEKYASIIDSLVANMAVPDVDILSVAAKHMPAMVLNEQNPYEVPQSESDDT